MGLITGDRVEIRDPALIDQQYRAYEGVGGASQQVITEALVIANDAGDSYPTGATVNNQSIDEDCVLTGIYAQLQYVAGGTRAITLSVTLSGQEIYRFEGFNGQSIPAINIPLPEWRIRKGENLTFTSSVGAGGSVTLIFKLYGFPSS